MTIGDIDIDEDELVILMLNPKFAALKRLDREAMENDIEVGLCKARYEARQIEESKRQEEIEYEKSDGKKQKIEGKKNK